MTATGPDDAVNRDASNEALRREAAAREASGAASGAGAGAGAGSGDASGDGAADAASEQTGPRPSVEPSRRDRFRPLELLSLSAVVAVFVGLIVFMSTREINVTAIFTGLSFIVTLLVLAMLALAVKPTGEERLDLNDQDRHPTGH